MWKKIWEISGRCRGDIGEVSSTCAANRMEPAWVATMVSHIGSKPSMESRMIRPG